MDLLIKLGIFVLGVCGFFVAKHIRDHKVKDKPLVCMIGFDCHAVVHSDYSKFMGMPVELGGMIYYGLTALVYLVLAVAPGLISDGLAGVFMALTCAAFLFSVYLIFIQIFILRKGCSWCIVSSIISGAMFVLNFSFWIF